jgi:ribosomal protein RSM22 (predicted rRNA methylase)
LDESGSGKGFQNKGSDEVNFKRNELKESERIKILNKSERQKIGNRLKEGQTE